MKLLTAAVAFLLTTSLVLSASARQTPPVSAAPKAPRTDYTLVQIKTGPKSGKLSKEDDAKAFEGHFANMGRMASERQLVVAGPYGEKRHDPALRGIFVLATAERAQAESWAGTDPTTRAGVFVLEYHTLTTRAPLEAALERDLTWRAELKAAGKTPGPAEGARPYVLLTAEHGDLAERELAPLLNPAGGVYLLGRLDGTRGFALLDAATLAEARERFAPQLEALGTCALDEWFASNQLARMVEPTAK